MERLSVVTVIFLRKLTTVIWKIEADIIALTFISSFFGMVSLPSMHLASAKLLVVNYADIPELYRVSLNQRIGQLLLESRWTFYPTLLLRLFLLLYSDFLRDSLAPDASMEKSKGSAREI